jgi:hypothetical protein
MKAQEKGWVVINNDHPAGLEPYIVSSTFACTRKKSISLFIDRSNASWRYWRSKYNFQCVKAESCITIT